MNPSDDPTFRNDANSTEAGISEVILKGALPVILGSLGWGLGLEVMQAGLHQQIRWMPTEGPAFLMNVGLMSLMALPIFRVGAALVAFAEDRDVVLVAVTIIVLSLLVWSFRMATGL